MQTEQMIILIIAYLFGSIPFGLVLTKLAGLGDIRKIGSGNIGATNVLRTGNKKLAIATLLLDGLKGALLIPAAHYFDMADIAPLVGLLAVLGHVFPVWLKFQGGKGVATTVAVILALNWVLGLAIIIIWILTFLITRISSLSAICAVTGGSAAAYYLHGNNLFTICIILLSLLVVIRHHKNIQRLIAGIEPKSSFGKREEKNG
jgi:glycerol-3-phosphate acyltransferase PlsY